MTLTQKKYEQKARKLKTFYNTHLQAHTKFLAAKLAKAYSIPPAHLFQQPRTKTITDLRRVLYHTLRQSGYSLTEISKTANRHHSTVIYYLKSPVPDDYKHVYKQLLVLSKKWKDKHLTN